MTLDQFLSLDSSLGSSFLAPFLAASSLAPWNNNWHLYTSIYKVFPHTTWGKIDKSLAMSQALGKTLHKNYYSWSSELSVGFFYSHFTCEKKMKYASPIWNFVSWFLHKLYQNVSFHHPTICFLRRFVMVRIHLGIYDSFSFVIVLFITNSTIFLKKYWVHLQHSISCLWKHLSFEACISRVYIMIT